MAQVSLVRSGHATGETDAIDQRAKAEAPCCGEHLSFIVEVDYSWS